MSFNRTPTRFLEGHSHSSIELFDWLIQGQVRSLFDISRTTAKREGKSLRVKLRFDTPALASLPWEFLYDPRHAEYVVLSTNTPLVRYIELPDPIEPLTVTPPLRILGLIASVIAFVTTGLK